METWWHLEKCAKPTPIRPKRGKGNAMEYISIKNTLEISNELKVKNACKTSKNTQHELRSRL